MCSCTNWLIDADSVEKCYILRKCNLLTSELEQAGCQGKED